ncbi:ferrous iron transport protein B [Hyperthermus butylicus]|uniref:Ferrous iron transport protein B n=1 Tax=Hyperthermus butylicus (strain DSM 5456 / JCM 9403 / PLM1-5) TaxID=415426 RepID=A2BJ73_HYPBU|nr:ferrous iron transport protein B [Hyperthermus butylicus]ABM80034.1 Ferrous iron transport protein [Hyperthermus butylicus DSM 5456]
MVLQIGHKSGTKTLQKGKDCKLVVALVGNPNVGKSTLFNTLTGKTAHVANWPGVTVELEAAVSRYGDKTICFVDLPGTYGISASSQEEVVAREFIVTGIPDVILVIADATAPERTLYLALQILELTARVVIALNKMDLAHSMGIHIHVDELEKKLGVPVVTVSALQRLGIDELMRTLIDVAEGRKGRKEPLRIDYGVLEPYIAELEAHIARDNPLKNYNPRWLAVRLIEGDPRLEELLVKAGRGDIVEKARELREHFRKSSGMNPEDAAVSARFEYAEKLVKGAIVRVQRPESKLAAILEELFQRPILGPVLGLSLLFLAFLAIFTVNTGFPLNIIFEELGYVDLAAMVEEYSISGLLGSFFNWLAGATEAALAGRTPEWIVSLLADGVIPGVGSVLSFLPLIMLVSAVIAMMEDSGVAPRIAMAMHGLFARFGLSGKALFPMLISFGCNVPGVMASRAAIEEEERIETVLAIPFIPCQARLLVLLAFMLTFVHSPVMQAAGVLAAYLLGILVYLLTALLVRRLYFKRRDAPEFVIEIPPIHKPSWRVVWWITWDYSKHFLKKAGGIILALSVVTWALLSYGPGGVVGNSAESYGAMLGKYFAPIAETLWGMDRETAWRVMFAVINGFIAKEALVETVALMQGTEDPVEALQSLGLTTPQAMALLVFVMLYLPCLATLAVMYQEVRSAKLVLAALAYMVSLATVFSLATYYVLLPLT